MKEPFFLLFFAGLAAFIYARFIEPLLIEVTSYELRDKGLPGEQLTILHLSDLHIKGRGWFEDAKLKRAFQKISHLPHPVDLILITGDFIEDDHGIQAAIDFIKKIPAPRLGLYACLGNHDYINHDFIYGLVGGNPKLLSSDWLPNMRLFFQQVINNRPLRLDFETNNVAELVSGLEIAGIRVLRNQNISIRNGDGHIHLVGVDDLREGDPNPDLAAAGIPPGAFTIVLAHNPDLMLDQALQKFDFAFSGHVHGGQIRLPFIGPFYTHGSHLPRRKTNGWFRFGNTDTFVSRGFGEGTPLRFNCRPEITLIKILRQAD